MKELHKKRQRASSRKSHNRAKEWDIVKQAKKTRGSAIITISNNADSKNQKDLFHRKVNCKAIENRTMEPGIPKGPSTKTPGIIDHTAHLNTHTPGKLDLKTVVVVDSNCSPIEDTTNNGKRVSRL